MARSYEVDICLEENKFGFILLCYEGDDCIWEQFFLNSDDARDMGERFLDGRYIKGFPFYAGVT